MHFAKGCFSVQLIPIQPASIVACRYLKSLTQCIALTFVRLGDPSGMVVLLQNFASIIDRTILYDDMFCVGIILTKKTLVTLIDILARFQGGAI